MSGPSFLYPHLQGAPTATATARDESDIEELAAAACRTWEVGDALDISTVAANATGIVAVATLIGAAVRGDAQVLVLGNGGSACDADRLVRLLDGCVRIRSLLDHAVLTALANDVGAARIFERQVQTYARAGDVVVAFSTSGTSANVIAALSAAKRAGAATVGLAGYGGGAFLAHADVDVCLHVDSSSVHRIQEAQGALCNELAATVSQMKSEIKSEMMFR